MKDYENLYKCNERTLYVRDLAKKTTSFLILGLGILLLHASFQNPYVHAVVTTIPLPTAGSGNTFVLNGVTANQTTTSTTTTPITQITSAIDGSRNSIARSGTTASTAITFTFVSTNISPSSVTFQCSLDNAAFTACISPKSYSNLRLGVHLFRVQSQSTAGVTGTPDTFVWTIQSTSLFGNLSSSATALKNNIGNSSLSATVIDATTAKAKIEGQLRSSQGTVNDILAGTATVTTINPPFDICDKADNDVAIYNIEGRAAVGNLFQNLPPKDRNAVIPMSLILFGDQKIGDPANLIVGHDNQYIVGRLVIHPEDPRNERDVNFEVKKINTECKATAIIKQSDRDNGPKSSTTNPDVIIPTRTNPPLKTCLTAPGVITKSQIFPGLTLTPGAAAAVGNFFNPVTQQIEHLDVGAAAPAGGGINGTVLIHKGGVPPDVAIYTFRGVVSTKDLMPVGQSQNVVLRIVNDLHAGTTPPEINTINQQGNNNEFTATLQLDPGEHTRWSVSNFIIHEISTSCTVIPFVNGPKAIGNGQAEDFAIQEISTNRFKSNNH